MPGEDQTQRPRRYYYQMPTRLNIEDKLVDLGPLSLTLRQGFVLVIGGCVAVNVWRWLDLLAPGELSVVLQLIATCVIMLLSVLIAFVRIADRYLENWARVLWRYWRLPKVYLWKRCPTSGPRSGQGRRERASGKRKAGNWEVLVLGEESEGKP